MSFTSHRRRLHAALLGLGLGLGLLAGCASSLLPKPSADPARFTLDDGAAAPAPMPAAAGAAPTLIVNPGRAAAGFDSAQIVYVRRAQEIEHFALNQWVDTPSHMLAPLMVRAIERTGGFKAVLLAPTAATARLRLDTELVRLQQDFSVTPSQVRLTLRAVLIDVSTRSVVARREFDTRIASTRDDPYGGVIAAQAATQQVLAELAAFCAAAAQLTAPAMPAKP